MNKALCTLLISVVFTTFLYAQNPPRLLQASLVDSTNVLLQWDAPFGGTINELSWSNEAAGAVGLSAGGTYAIAARWEPAQLASYDGFILHELLFYQYSTTSTYTLKIWKGAGAQNLAYIQPVTTMQEAGWSVVPINNTLLLDASQEFWIGIEINQPENDFPASIDNGPAVVGFGDKINFQGVWENLSSYGIDANFSLKLMLHDAQGKTVMLDASVPDRAVYQASGSIQQMRFSAEPGPDNNIRGAQAIPDEFRVYRNQNLIATTSTTELSWLDTNLSAGSYQYAVTAMYGTNESAPSKASIQIGSPPYLIQPEQFVDTFPLYETVSRTITFFNNSSNALSWQSATTSPWIVTNPVEGSIAAGGSQEISVTFYTYGFNPGSYRRFINFTTSDPAFSTYSYPLNFSIITQPQITIYQSNLDFGNISIGQTFTMPVGIYNGGSDTLQLTNIATDNPVFAVPASSLAIPPYHFQSLFVSFSPQELQGYNGNLNFDLNIPGNNSYSIPLSGNGVLQPPLFLNAQLQNDNDVRLDWLANSSGDGNWITYSTDVYSTSVGLMDGGTFQMAARWPAGTLTAFAGQPLVRVAFYPSSQSSLYTLKIWQGQQAGTLMHSQQLSQFQPYQWNEIALNSQVLIDANQDLWIGFEMVHAGNEYPGALAQGAPLPGLGDMVNVGGQWQSLSEFGLPYNWMIKGLVASSPSALPLALPQPETALNQAVTGTLKSQTIEAASSEKQGNAQLNPVFQGYNLYRNGTLLNSALLQQSSFTDLNLPDGIFTYGVTSVYDLGESNPTQRSIQIGGPILSVNPSSITDTLAYGLMQSYTLTFTNTGNSALMWSPLDLPYYLQLSGDSANIILPGQSSTATLTVLSEFLYPGTFFYPVRILTNNINDSVTVLPTSFRIEGGNILLGFQYDTLDFGLVGLSQYIQKQMTVTNLSASPVYINTFSDLINFQPYLTNWYLMPGQSAQAVVSFSGSQAGTYNGNLVFQTYSGTDQAEFTVPVKAMIGFPPPSAFTAALNGQAVELSWFPPGTNPGLLQYGNGLPFSSVGFASSGTLTAAIKFSPAELMAYAGKQLTAVEFYSWSSLPVFKARIFTGPNAENLIFEQLISNPATEGWNVAQLSTPIPVMADDYLWIGYEMIQSVYDFPAGIDIGPAIEGKGDLISINGAAWTTLSSYGLPYNWNIRGILSTANSNNQMMPVVLEQIRFDAINTDIVPVLNARAGTEANAVSWMLLGYNLYRDGQKLNNSLIPVLSYTDVPDYTGNISYALTAVYDVGESLPSTINVQIDPPVNLPEGWEFTRTRFVHNIYIPAPAALSSLGVQYGDMFGVFYLDGSDQRCAGAAMFVDGQMVLQAFGDDPATPQKEGFAEGEAIIWKFHQHGAAVSQNMNVTYNTTMPDHDGVFRNLGLSMLATMETGVVGTQENDRFSLISLYPNPSSGDAQITGLQPGMLLTVTDLTGRILLKKLVNSPTEQLNFEFSGIFIVEIQEEGKAWRRKMVVSK